MRINHIYFFIILILISSIPIFTQIVDENSEIKGKSKVSLLLESSPEKDDIIRYQINARLFPKKGKLEGIEIIKWTNRSDIPVNELQFNLFYNAFSDINSTFFKESKIFKLSPEELKKKRFGSIKIDEFKIINRNEKSTNNISFISPDDGNSSDKSVASVKLFRPVEPKKAIWIKIKFTLKIPEIFFKTGQEDDYFFMSHWYPRIGCLSEDGKWITHQFHNNSTFCSDFGNYNVKITIPSRFKIGSTGVQTGKTEKGKEFVEYEFEEKNIPDFAWVVSPHFNEIREKVRLKGNEFDTELILLLSPGHRSAKERYLNAIKFSLKYFEENFTSYPFRTLTVVDPPLKGFYSAGFEYPTLISAAFLKIIPRTFRLSELAVVHGICHQFWYGIVGSDEWSEPWLMEGITAFLEMEIMDSLFPESGSFLNASFMNINDWEMKRRAYLTFFPGKRMYDLPDNLLNDKNFIVNPHSGFSLLLRSLKNYVGKDKFNGFLKYFFSRYKNKIARASHFEESFIAYMQEDFSWAFEQFTSGRKNLDTAVFSITSDPVGGSRKYRNEIVFVRNSGYFPTELKIRLENGKEIKIFWEKNEKWKKVVFDDNSPVDFAIVDPGFKIPLDINLVNNSMVIKKNRSVFKKLAVRFGFYFQNILGFLPL
ncbi:MAG: M1 family metallopeptidase [Acidobacteriota bacterium]